MQWRICYLTSRLLWRAPWCNEPNSKKSKVALVRKCFVFVYSKVKIISIFFNVTKLRELLYEEMYTQFLWKNVPPSSLRPRFGTLFYGGWGGFVKHAHSVLQYIMLFYTPPEWSDLQLIHDRPEQGCRADPSYFQWIHFRHRRIRTRILKRLTFNESLNVSKQQQKILQ